MPAHPPGWVRRALPNWQWVVPTRHLITKNGTLVCLSCLTTSAKVCPKFLCPMVVPPLRVKELSQSPISSFHPAKAPLPPTPSACVPQLARPASSWLFVFKGKAPHRLFQAASHDGARATFTTCFHLSSNNPSPREELEREVG